MFAFVCESVESIVGKAENAFSFSHSALKFTISYMIKTRDSVEQY